MMTSEGRLTSLYEIDEYGPFKHRHVSGNKHQNVNLNSKYSGRKNMALTQNVSSVASSTGLQNSTTSNLDYVNQKNRDNIKAKVAYEWKSIFKNLVKVDTENTGSVTKEQF